MAPPDLNSLPPSRSMSSSPLQPRAMTTTTSPPNRNDTPSPRASSISLATAAITNAANESSRRSSLSARGSPRLGRMPSDRRRSQAAMNFSLNLNDPALPSPGELSSSDPRLSFNHSYASASPPTIGGRSAIATGDPHHQRQPSLGEIHNELEQEQEAQVNRMLQMIREQQLQLDALRNNSQHTTEPSQSSAQSGSTGLAVLDDDQTPASERSISFPSVHPAVPPQQQPPPPTRRFSRDPSSASRSPALRPLPSQEASADWPSSPVEGGRRGSFRDESAFYQAETAMLTRENQLLRQRIRELEKQIAEMEILPPNAPATPSNLATNPPIEAEEEAASVAAAVARITAEQDKT